MRISRSNIGRKDAIRRRTVLRGAGAAGIGMTAGCLSGGGEDDDAITIGSIQPLSGPFTSWGQAHRAGLQFAIDEINEDGGVLDQELRIVESDSESNPSEANTLFSRFVESENAVAVTGPVSSDVGLNTAQTAEDMEVPLVMHMVGTHQLHSRESRYTFRMGSLPAPMDLQVVAELIESEGFSNVGAVNADYEWGNTVDDLIDDFFPDDIELTTAMAPQGESDFTPYLRDFPDDIEMIAATGHPPGQNSIHSQALEIELEHEMTTGAGQPPGTIYDDIGDGAETFAHLHIADVYDDQFIDVAERFADETGERMDTHEAIGYVTGELIATAIEEADSTDPVDVAESIRNIELDTLFAAPLQYNEWGEIDDVVAVLSTFEEEAPEYYSDGEFRLVEQYRSEPMSAELIEPLIE